MCAQAHARVLPRGKARGLIVQVDDSVHACMCAWRVSTCVRASLRAWMLRVHAREVGD